MPKQPDRFTQPEEAMVVVRRPVPMFDLGKYDPDQPRDDQGQWTDGATDAQGNTVLVWDTAEIGHLESRDHAGKLRDLEFAPGSDSDKRVRAIMATASATGITEPIEIGRTDTSRWLHDGHHRYVAARRLGIKVPIIGYDEPVRKYDPSQPRDPAGTETGGRWVSTAPGPDDALSALERQHEGLRERLTQEERFSVSSYQNGQYSDWNRFLRGGNEPADAVIPKWRDGITNLDSAMEKAGPLGLDVVSWRGGAGAKWGESLEAGDEVTDMGYASSSTHPKVAHNFAAKEVSHGDSLYMYRLHVPARARAMWVRGATGDKSGENEVLLGRGSRFRVIGKSTISWQAWDEISDPGFWRGNAPMYKDVTVFDMEVL